MSREQAHRLAIVSLPALIIAGAVLYAGIWKISSGHSIPFRNFDLVQVEGTKNAEMVAISSDAGWLAYVLDEGGMESLWVRSLGVHAAPQRLLPPANVMYSAVAFAPDNAYIYYTHTDPAKGPEADYYILYRIPLNGGDPQRLINDVDGNISFSPDGRRVLFLRANDPTPGVSLVIDASVNGGDEHIVQTNPNLQSFTELAWAPDGKTVAEVPFSGAGTLGTLVARDYSSGKTRNIFQTPDHLLSEINWLPSGNAVALIYRSKDTGLLLGQIGLISYPDGEFRRVTSDMGDNRAVSMSERIQRLPADASSYQSLSVARDGKSMASVLRQMDGSVYVASLQGQTYGDARRLGSGDPNWGATWLDDQQILIGKYSNLLSVPTEGGELNTFYSARAVVRNPVTCRKSGYVAVVHGMGTRDLNIWGVSLDGSSARRLTPGNNDIAPTCSPDGNWLIYVDSTRFLMKMPAQGGDPVRVANLFWQRGGHPQFSPDGKLLAAGTYDFENAEPKLAIVDFEANKVLQSLHYNPAHVGNRLAFSADGKAVIYPIRQNGVDNLWAHPLDGSPGHLITNFTDMKILNFEFSPDRSRLMLVRGELPTEVVLIRDRAR